MGLFSSAEKCFFERARAKSDAVEFAAAMVILARQFIVDFVRKSLVETFVVPTLRRPEIHRILGGWVPPNASEELIVRLTNESTLALLFCATPLAPEDCPQLPFELVRSLPLFAREVHLDLLNGDTNPTGSPRAKVQTYSANPDENFAQLLVAWTMALGNPPPKFRAVMAEVGMPETWSKSLHCWSLLKGVGQVPSSVLSERAIEILKGMKRSNRDIVLKRVGHLLAF